VRSLLTATWARVAGLHRRASRHSTDLLAAGVAFYFFLGLFPALGAAVSIFGLLAGHPPAAVAPATEGPLSVLRADLRHHRERLARQPRQDLGRGAAIGFFLAVWSASKGARALTKALNAVYEREETRRYLRRRAAAVVLTLAWIALVVVAALLAAAVPPLLRALGLGEAARGAIGLLRWPTLLVLMMAALGPIYRYGPCHPRPRPGWLSTGALTAALVWGGGSWLLSMYLASLSQLDRIYGGLAAVVGLLFWLYLSAAALLLGAELNASAERP
jgi:membrane protein